jgi:hypothetical protein
MRFACRIALFALFAMVCATALAAPVGYSVNSDQSEGDSLYEIDLSTGKSTKIGDVLAPLGIRSDIEGLAFDSSRKLWAVDDESGMLFPVNTTTALVVAEEEVTIDGISTQGNDFGMTFTCEGSLFFTSVESQSLYSLSLDGTATLVGSLGARISAIAAFGNPAKLYGMGNGLVNAEGALDNRSLYEIDTATGEASLIGNVGADVDDYFEAGLSFDDEGKLWAITERHLGAQSLPSQVLTLDVETGVGTVVSTTQEVTGFESLAIAPPAGCELGPGGPPDNLPQIPVLDRFGMLLVFLVLLVTGMSVLRRNRA